MRRLILKRTKLGGRLTSGSNHIGTIWRTLGDYERLFNALRSRPTETGSVVWARPRTLLIAVGPQTRARSLYGRARHVGPWMHVVRLSVRSPLLAPYFLAASR